MSTLKTGIFENELMMVTEIYKIAYEQLVDAGYILPLFVRTKT